MARLNVTLHDGNYHSLNVDEGYAMPDLSAEGWVTLAGNDGNYLYIHTRSIAAIVLLTTGSAGGN